MKKLVLLSLVLLAFGCETTPADTEPTDEQAAPPPIDNGENPGNEAAPPSEGEEAPPSMEDPMTPPGDHAPDSRSGPEPTPASTGDGVNVELVDRTVVVEEPSRARKRMNLDQLNAAFTRTSGGITWTERRGGRDANQFVELSATLGKPDFIQVTTENLEASTLFQKFLDDAARSVCAKMIERDRSGETEPLLLTADAMDDTIRTNLRSLVYRFHNRSLGPDSPDLEQWVWLFDSVRFVRDVDAGWNAVCVTLFNHPDFYTY
jgi:hypothetical protein